MRRWLIILTGFAMAFVGVVFSAINLDDVALDFFYFTIRVPAGVLVLASVLLGFVLSGVFLYAGVIVPLRMRLGTARREVEQRKAAP